MPDLSADIYLETNGKTWAAVIREHSKPGSRGIIVWRKNGMRAEHNAETAMEAAWRRLMKGR